MFAAIDGHRLSQHRGKSSAAGTKRGNLYVKVEKYKQPKFLYISIVARVQSHTHKSDHPYVAGDPLLI